MSEKWNKKIIAEYAEQLKSPFDGVGQKTGLAGGLQKLKDLVTKKKETQ